MVSAAATNQPAVQRRISVYGHTPWSALGSQVTSAAALPVGLLKPNPAYVQEPRVIEVHKPHSFYEPESESSFYSDDASGLYDGTSGGESSVMISVADSGLHQSSVYPSRSVVRSESSRGTDIYYHSPGYYYD